MHARPNQRRDDAAAGRLAGDEVLVPVEVLVTAKT
jgi:hypothetical protein